MQLNNKLHTYKMTTVALKPPHSLSGCKITLEATSTKHEFAYALARCYVNVENPDDPGTEITDEGTTNIIDRLYFHPDKGLVVFSCDGGALVQLSVPPASLEKLSELYAECEKTEGRVDHPPITLDLTPSNVTVAVGCC